MPAGSLLPRGEGGLLRRFHHPGDARASRKNPLAASHDKLKSDDPPPPLAPVISPHDEERLRCGRGGGQQRQRRHRPQQQAGGVDTDGIEKRKKQLFLARGGESQPALGGVPPKNGNADGIDGLRGNKHGVAMMIHERQMDKMGGIGIISPKNDDGGRRYGDGAATSAGWVKKTQLPPTVTPMASARRQAAVVHSTRANSFQSPRKPATAVDSPVATRASARPHQLSSATPYSVGVAPHFGTLSGLGSPPPPQYSPVTPDTHAIMATESPFKSSMQLLDERLKSVMKMEGSLERRIEGIREMYEGGSESSFECEEGLHWDVIRQLTEKEPAKEKQRDGAGARERVRWDDEAKEDDAEANSSTGDAISELSEEMEDRGGGGGGLALDDRRPVTQQAKYGTGSGATAIVEEETPQRPYDSDSEYSNPRRVRRHEAGRRASVDASSSTKSNECKSLHYLLDKEMRHDIISQNGLLPYDKEDAQYTLSSVEDTFESSFASSPVELRRVLWRGGGETPREESSFRTNSSAGNAFTSPPEASGEHLRANNPRSVPSPIGSSLARHVSSSPVMASNGTTSTDLTKHHPLHQQFHFRRYRPDRAAPENHLGSTTPLAPKQLYQSRIEKADLSSSPDDTISYDGGGDGGAGGRDTGQDAPTGSNRENAWPRESLVETYEVEERGLISPNGFTKSHGNDQTTGRKNSLNFVGGMFKRMKVGSTKRVQQPPNDTSTPVEPVLSNKPQLVQGNDNQPRGSLQARLKQGQHQFKQDQAIAEKREQGQHSDPHVCALLRQHADTQHHLDQMLVERKQLLNMVSKMRSQLIELARDRDSATLSGEASVRRAKRYKREARTLESQMSLTLNMVQEVQEKSAYLEEEANGLCKLLRGEDSEIKKRNVAHEEMWRTLASREDQVRTLSIDSKRKEDELMARLKDMDDEIELRDAALEQMRSVLASKEDQVKKLSIDSERMEVKLASRLAMAERQREEDMVEITDELRQAHHYETEWIKSSHSVQLEELEAYHAAQMAKAEESRRKEVERVRTEVEVSSALSLEERVLQLSSSHASELQELKMQLQQESSAENKEPLIQCKRREEELTSQLANAKRLCEEHEEYVMGELRHVHDDEMERIALSYIEQLEQLEASHMAQLEKVQASQGETLQRVRMEIEASSALSFEERARELSSSHTSELEELREELQQSSLAKIEELSIKVMRKEEELVSQLANVERLHEEDLVRVTRELSLVHEDAMERVKSSHRDQLKQIETSHAAQLVKVEASHAARHKEEIKRVRDEMETSSALTLEERGHQLSLCHAAEMQKLRAELQQSSPKKIEELSTEVKRKEEEFISQLANVERLHEEDVDRVTRELSLVHEDTLEMMKSSHRAQLKQMETSHAAQLERVESSHATWHKEEIKRVRETMKTTSAVTLEERGHQLSSSHAAEMEQLRAELQQSSSAKMKELSIEVMRKEDELTSQLANIERLHEEDMDRVTRELSLVHDGTMERMISSHRVQLEQIEISHAAQLEKLEASHVAWHKEDVHRVRKEMEASSALTLEEKGHQLSSSHAAEMQELIAQLKQLSTAKIEELSTEGMRKEEELKSHLANIERLHEEGVDRVTRELSLVYDGILKRMKSSHRAQLEQIESSHAAQLEQAEASYTARQQEQLKCAREEIELLLAFTLEKMAGRLSLSHAAEMDELRAELQQSLLVEVEELSIQLKREEGELISQLANIDSLREGDLARVTRGLHQVHDKEMKMTNLSYVAKLEQTEASHAAQSEKGKVSHGGWPKGDIRQLRREMEATLALEGKAQELPSSHAAEPEDPRAELQVSPSADVKELSIESEGKEEELEAHLASIECPRGEKVEHIMEQLCQVHNGETARVNLSYITQLEQLKETYEEETEKVRKEAEALHAAAMEDLRAKQIELMKRKEEEYNVQLPTFEHRREQVVERVTTELNKRHVDEMGSAELKMLESTDVSHVAGSAQMDASNQEEVESVCKKKETSALALEERKQQLSASNANALEHPRIVHIWSYLAEMERILIEAKKQSLDEIDRVSHGMLASPFLALYERLKKMSIYHADELECQRPEVQLVLLAEMERVQREAEGQRNEASVREREETEETSALAFEERVWQFPTSSAKGSERQRMELQAASSAEIEHVPREVEKQSLEEIICVRKEIEAPPTLALEERVRQLPAPHADAFEDIGDTHIFSTVIEIAGIGHESEELMGENEEYAAVLSTIGMAKAHANGNIVIFNNGPPAVFGGDNSEKNQEEDNKDSSLGDESFYIGQKEVFHPSQSVETDSDDDGEYEDSLSTSYTGEKSVGVGKVLEPIHTAEDEGSSWALDLEDRIREKLSLFHSPEVKGIRKEVGDYIEEINQLKRQLEQHAFFHKGKMDILLFELELSADQATCRLQNRHNGEFKNLGLDIESLLSMQLKEARAVAEERRGVELKHLTSDPTKPYLDEMQDPLTSQPKSKNQPVVSHTEGSDSLRLDVGAMKRTGQLKDEFTNFKTVIIQLLSQQEKVQSYHTLQMPSFYEKVQTPEMQGEDQAHKMRQNMKETENCHDSYTATLKRYLDEQRSYLKCAIEENRRQLNELEQQECDLEQLLSLSSPSNLETHPNEKNKGKEQGEEDRQLLMKKFDDINANFMTSSHERGCLFIDLQGETSLLLASQVEKEYLSFQLGNICEEKAGIGQQLVIAHAECDELSKEVKDLQISPGGVYVERKAAGISLNNAKEQIKSHNGCTASLETKRGLQSAYIEDLQWQLEDHKIKVESLNNITVIEANQLKETTPEISSTNEEKREREDSSERETLSLQTKLSNVETCLAETPSSREELLRKHLRLAKAQDSAISKKKSLVIEVVEESALISLLEAQNKSLLSVMKGLEAKNISVMGEIAAFDNQRSKAININKQDEEQMFKLTIKTEFPLDIVVILNSNIEHLKCQIAYESQGRRDLVGEKLVIEKQLRIVQDEWDQVASELDDLKDNLSAVSAESQSKILMVDDANLQMDSYSNQIHELERQLSSKRGDSQEIPERSEIIPSRDHLQGLAAKFSITVIKLKMEPKRKDESINRFVSPAKDQCQQSKQCLVKNVKADWKALAAKLVQQHGKLVNAFADNHILFETLMLHENLESALSLCNRKESPFPILEEKLKWMVVKLASTLVKLKARDMNLLKNTISHRKQIFEHQKVPENAQNDLKSASEEKAGLNRLLVILANEKDILHNDFLSLGKNLCDLEYNHQISTQVKRDLEKPASDKDAEIQQLHAVILNRTGVLFELRQQNEQLKRENFSIKSMLKSREATQENDRVLIEHLWEENILLQGVEADLRIEKEAASEIKIRLEQTEEALLKIEAAKVLAKNHLEEVMQEKMHLSAEVESMRDAVALLEAEKELLYDKVSECEERALLLSNKVTTLMNQAKLNEQHIFDTESQFAGKVAEADILTRTTSSHQATLGEIRIEMLTLEQQKVDVEQTLSELHRRIDHMMGEHDGLASQLDKAVSELETTRTERNSLAAKATDISIVQTTPDNSFNKLGIVDSELETARYEDSSCNGISDFLKSTCIPNEEEMNEAKSIIAQIELEKKVLKKEVEHMRAGFERAQEELVIAKEDYNNVTRQTLALRDVVSQARSLIKKSEVENNQLASDLENANKTMKRIQKNASQSYNAIVSQSQDDIKKLKMELKQRDESIKCLMSSSMEKPADIISIAGTPKQTEISKGVSSKTAIVSHLHTRHNSPKVSSKDRFKVERGSMFSMLKGMKRSGRKDRVKYRKIKE